MMRFLATAIILASPTIAKAGPVATFKDWTVNCTDGLFCTASILTPGDAPLSGLAIARGVEPNAPLTLQLMTAEAVPLSAPLKFAPDGQTAVVLDEGEWSRTSAEEPLSSTDPTIRDDLLPALLNASSVELSTGLGGRTASATFSLQGISAALRWMDVAQYRDGTATALVAVGKAAGRDPARLPKDIATADDLPKAVRAMWSAEADLAGQCGDASVGETFGPLGFSAALGDDRLYGLRCGYPGAYNYAMAFFVMSGEQVFPVPLPTMSNDGPTATMQAINPDWDDRSKTLTDYAKGRGLGDCGMSREWQWLSEPDAATMEPVLKTAFSKLDCDGTPFGEEGTVQLWPPQGTK